MSVLADSVTISRRFARSARLDTDLNGTPPLVGYVLQASVEKALAAIAASQIDSRQGAFTWTGPYGGGKSSAALLVANLVAHVPANRKIARKIAGKPLTAAFAKAFPEADGPWSVIAVTGSRTGLRDAIVAAAALALDWSDGERDAASLSDEALIDQLDNTAQAQGGVLLLLDELGKLLEHEAGNGGDVHLLQDIAERATRSSGKLVVIGILHQSFDQYAARAARDARQEWAKVQGRYQDIAFLSGADETVALLGQAITAPAPPSAAVERALAVAAAVANRRPTDPELLGQALAATWPLNPVTALLLGPVSRQRFAQNERSLFGFLSSAEQAGFQEFLASAGSDEDYGPHRLWDYLVVNFGMALAGGNDGARFSLAFEAIERATAKGSELHVIVAKTAAAIELFRNGSGLALADEFLVAAVAPGDAGRVKAITADLVEWSILIRQPRLGGYALFAGSDFDLEDAIARATTPLDDGQLGILPRRVGLGFATAKRHYFRTGAMRTFDIGLHLAGRDSDIEAIVARIAAHAEQGSGCLALLLNDGSAKPAELNRMAEKITGILRERRAIAAVGSIPDSYALRATASELFAIERIIRDHPQLEGDRIARREVAARQSAGVDQLHRVLDSALSGSVWRIAPGDGSKCQGSLAAVATTLADAGYPDAPLLHSELLQRDRPSSNAMAALRELGYAMIVRSDAADLGIEGFPAEKGLYLTLLAPFGLHRADGEGKIGFHAPDDSVAGRSLSPAWKVVERAGDSTAEAIYAAWARPPYGIKRGVMPILLLAYLLANQDRMAVYVDGVFQTAITDIFFDKLLQRSADIRIRPINRSIREAAFLSGLARAFDVEEDGQSLPVAAALFQAFEALPPFAARTMRLAPQTLKVRAAVTAASDPEGLLFDALPEALGDVLDAETVLAALDDCRAAYPALLDQMRAALARALGVDPVRFDGIAERAATLEGLTNAYDFDAFARRAAAFDGGGGDIEGLVSLLLHRPAHNWSDRDHDQALIEMAAYGRRFRELEALAVVRDRRSHTEAVALVVGIDPKTPPLLQSFELTDAEKLAATALADTVLRTLLDKGDDDRLRLAALARAVASLAAQAAPEAEAA
jgi:hypothetical protein